jgi:hypothetical protein
MSTIDRTQANRTQANPQLSVSPAVNRKTEKSAPGPSFGALMGTAAELALSGVEIGATVVGGPLVGAAVREVREVAVPAGPLGGGGGGGRGGASGDGGTLNEVRDMQEQAQSFNLQYLALQEEVQQENRRFTTVSNVLKAKHETAKGAIGNIRS